MAKSDRLHFYIDLATNTVESFRDSADAASINLLSGAGVEQNKVKSICLYDLYTKSGA